MMADLSLKFRFSKLLSTSNYPRCSQRLFVLKVIFLWATLALPLVALRSPSVSASLGRSQRHLTLYFCQVSDSPPGAHHTVCWNALFYCLESTFASIAVTSLPSSPQDTWAGCLCWDIFGMKDNSWLQQAFPLEGWDLNFTVIPFSPSYLRSKLGCTCMPTTMPPENGNC